MNELAARLFAGDYGYFVIYDIFTIPLIISYMYLFYKNREEEKSILIRPIYSHIYLNITIKAFIFYLVFLIPVWPSISLVIFVFVYPQSFLWQFTGIMNIFLLFLAVQRVIIIFNLSKLMTFVRCRGRNLVFFLIYIYSFFAFYFLELSCDKTRCPSQRVFENDWTCSTQKGDNPKNEVHFYHFQIIVFIDIISPCISLILHFVIYIRLRNRKEGLSRTKKHSEISILLQNIPVLFYSVLRLFIALLVYFKIRLNYALSREIICTQDRFHFTIIPFCYVFGKYEFIVKLRNRIMSLFGTTTTTLELNRISEPTS